MKRQVNWKSLSPSTQKSLIELYNRATGPVATDEDRLELQQTADHYQQDIDTFKRNMRMLRAAFPEHDDREYRKAKQSVEQNITRIKTLDVQRLTNVGHDQAELRRLSVHKYTTQPVVTILVGSDFHFPFHDWDAVRLFYKIAEITQPDFVLYGSDEFDHPLLSDHWEADPYIKVDDWIENSGSLHAAHVNNVLSVAPNSTGVFLWGNHDIRGAGMIAQSNAPRTLWDKHLSDIKHGGAVKYLGHTQEWWPHPQLLIAHELASGNNVAGKLLKHGPGLTMVQGHTHRPEYASVSSYAGQTTAVVTGHHALHPEYAIRKGKHINNWVHGCALVQITKGSVSVQQLVYQRNVHTIWAFVGTELVSVEVDE